MPRTHSPSLRETRTHGSQSFRCGYYTADPDGPSLHARLHWHDELEIICFQKGRFLLEINMEQLQLEAPCIAFVNSGELHRIDAEGPCRESAIVFSPHLLGFVSNDEAQSRILAPLSEQQLGLPRCLTPLQKCFPEVLQAYQKIAACMTDPMPEGAATAFDAGSQLIIKAGLLKILGLLYHYDLLKTARNQKNENVESVKTVLLYIHSHYPERITVADLAGLLNLNEQYFCRFFKKCTGKSPISYVNEYRIRRAMHLLEETSLPVTEICLSCGFNNYGNFLREFRSGTMTTPQKYRQQRSKANIT